VKRVPWASPAAPRGGHVVSTRQCSPIPGPGLGALRPRPAPWASLEGEEQGEPAAFRPWQEGDGAQSGPPDSAQGSNELEKTSRGTGRMTLVLGSVRPCYRSHSLTGIKQHGSLASQQCHAFEKPNQALPDPVTRRDWHKRGLLLTRGLGTGVVAGEEQSGNELPQAKSDRPRPRPPLLLLRSHPAMHPAAPPLSG